MRTATKKETLKKSKVSTGLPGLDEILHGGLIPNRSYLLQGGPGTGKSTLGYHFLRKGLDNGEKTLYITLGESEELILDNARRIGIDLEEANFLDLTPDRDLDSQSTNYNVFPSSEVEQKPLIESIVEAVRELEPERVVLDSVTMFRFLNQDPFQYRNLGLSFIKFICRSGATLLMISESTDQISDRDATFWVDGIIQLEYIREWRKVQISKYRGSDYRHGNHAYKITSSGAEIFPQLQPGNYNRKFTDGQLSSGIGELDKLLYGGIEKGTTTLITGPTGAGKTNLSLQFIKEAATRNERSAIYTFEESRDVLIRRSRSVNIPIDEIIEKGNLKIVPVEPLSYSPDEFSKMVRTDVEENDTRIVMIDSIGGYSLAVGEENTLERLHALTVYLQNMGVTSFLINEAQNITGDFSATGMHVSYLADNILFLRYLEVSGKLNKAIGVLKKRLSDFEKTIRKFHITPEGIKVGKPYTNLRGILSGIPELMHTSS